MIKWMVQKNLLSISESGDCKKIKDACEKYGYKYEGIDVIPFSGDVPIINPNDPIVFYGGTGWINNIYNKYKNIKGIFFNPNSVFTNWVKKYKTLNSDAKETTLIELSKENIDGDTFLFIRPVSDLKEFNGSVMTFEDIKNWNNKIKFANEDFGNIPIVVGEAYNISHEWRLFIINGKVITGSQYRTYFVLNTNESVPQNVIDFAEEQARIYSPSDIFVMDVCKCSNELYVLEVGCFNSAGFYLSNIDKIVNEVSKYLGE